MKRYVTLTVKTVYEITLEGDCLEDIERKANAIKVSSLPSVAIMYHLEPPETVSIGTVSPLRVTEGLKYYV